MFDLNHCAVLLCIFPLPLSHCWQFFDSLSDLRTTKNGTETNTEFIYGQCRPNYKIVYYTHVHLTNEDVVKKSIVRGWLEIPKVPTCIRIRGTFYEEDMFRSTAYNFQMCTPVITYIHDKNRYRYFYYEWYLPDEELPGVNWDLYFYGTPGEEWGLLKYE